MDRVSRKPQVFAQLDEGGVLKAVLGEQNTGINRVENVHMPDNTPHLPSLAVHMLNKFP
jgi:hypothetical protein